MYRLFSGTVVTKSGLMILVSRAAGIQKVICLPVCLAFCFACDGGFFFVDDDCFVDDKGVFGFGFISSFTIVIDLFFFLWDGGVVVVDSVHDLRHL
jgi:hypothetical protein